MICVNCKKEMKKVRTNYEYRESGLIGVTLGNITAYKCKECKEVYPVIANIKELHRVIGQELINKNALLTGEELVFLRKEMRIRAKDLAQVLGVHKVTISRWENKKERIGPAADRLIRMLYRSKIFEEKCEIAKPEIEKLKFGRRSAQEFLTSLCEPTSAMEEVLKNIRNRQIRSKISINRDWGTATKRLFPYGSGPGLRKPSPF
jgi:putative zinc finger/helix-turn-helix YgiT family protein